MTGLALGARVFSSMFALEPPPYLLRLRDWLRDAEPNRWRWFASDSFASDSTEAVRLELLQSTYRLEESAHPGIYAIARRALSALELDVPVTFYQAQGDLSMNAALCYLPGEAHVVLRGPVLTALDEAELVALVAHELAHYTLWSAHDGSLRVSNEVIESIAAHPGAQPSHRTTALRARRHTELYADRGSLLVCGDPRPVISCLVKVGTGLAQVDSEAYVRQADEIFTRKADTSSEGITHPESFIRARALWLFHQRQAEAEPEVIAMVHGPLAIETLDLLDQVELTRRTRVLVRQVLAPRWFQTEAVLAHARSFFPDAGPVEVAPAKEAGDPETAGLSPSVRDYFSYVLLDFAVVDPSLGEVALAHACQLAERLGLDESFGAIAREELRMTKKAFDLARNQAAALLDKAQSQLDKAQSQKEALS